MPEEDGTGTGANQDGTDMSAHEGGARSGPSCLRILSILS